MTWPTKKLGKIARIRTGKKDVNEGNPDGKYPFFTCSRERTYSDTYSFDTEAILVAGNGDVGNTQTYKGKFEAYQRTYVLDNFEGDIKYIYYYLISRLKKILVRSKSGSTMPYIRKGDLENFDVLMPENSSEQKKIVYVLDSIQEAVRVQEKIIEKTKKLKKSLMAEIFNSKFKSQKSKLQFKIQKRRLGEICKLRKEQCIPQSEDKYIGLEHLGSGEIKIKTFEKGDIVRSTKNRFYPGDILYGKLRPYLDKVALADFEGVCSTDILVLECDKKKVLPFYLANFLHSPEFLGFAIGTTSGTNHPRTSWDSLRSFEISLLSLPEQREIAKILQTIDQKFEIEQKKKALYEELFGAMLEQLMMGRIRVDNLKI